MAFTQAFTVAQSIDATSFSVTDTSTGSDSAIAGRRIFPQLADGTYLLPTGNTSGYIDFPLSVGATIDIIGLLTIDYALSITINWVDVSGNTLYTLSQSYDFVGNDEDFMYGLVQGIAANRGILQNQNFIFNCFKISMYADYSQKSVETGDDIQSAQQLLSYAQDMINKSATYFQS
jgi:hypothetical protein